MEFTMQVGIYIFYNFFLKCDVKMMLLSYNNIIHVRFRVISLPKGSK